MHKADDYTVMRYNARSHGIYQRSTKTWVKFGAYEVMKREAVKLNNGSNHK